MKIVIFNFYFSEYKKLLSLLNEYKDKGYIVTRIDEESNKLEFERTNKQFVYSLDYSNLYASDRFFMDFENERFDNAKLDNWQLQCFDSGIGIWINEDINCAVPFFLDEEYEEIEQKDYQEFRKSLKPFLIGLAIFLLLDILVVFKSRLWITCFILPILLLEITIIVDKLKKKEFITKRTMNLLWLICFTSLEIGRMDLSWLMFREVLLLWGIIDITREKSMLFRNPWFFRGYEIIIIGLMIADRFILK